MGGNDILRRAHPDEHDKNSPYSANSIADVDAFVVVSKKKLNASLPVLNYRDLGGNEFTSLPGDMLKGLTSMTSL